MCDGAVDEAGGDDDTSDGDVDDVCDGAIDERDSDVDDEAVLPGRPVPCFPLRGATGRSSIGDGRSRLAVGARPLP